MVADNVITFTAGHNRAHAHILTWPIVIDHIEISGGKIFYLAP